MGGARGEKALRQELWLLNSPLLRDLWPSVCMGGGRHELLCPRIPTVYITPYTISPPNQTEDMCLPAQTPPPPPSVIATPTNPAKKPNSCPRTLSVRIECQPVLYGAKLCINRAVSFAPPFSNDFWWQIVEQGGTWATPFKGLGHSEGVDNQACATCHKTYTFLNPHTPLLRYYL